ncbi:M14 family metallopeptidase [Acidobacteriia bacterium AH_259_A11_L15]|nr:M14 family metallopeptidase [Acidobacteriia bacterium AH_259_A11_L15]
MLKRLALVGLLGPLLLGLAAAAPEIPSPEKFFARPLGEDLYLASYPKIVEYFHALDAASDRVTVELAGRSTLGNDMLVVILTSEANQQQLDHYRTIAQQLANPDTLTEEQAHALIAEGKPIVLVTCTIHSTEVGCTQMAPEFAYEVATTTDPGMLAWLDDVILLLMPSINPDGQVMVIDWYDKYLGTEYEGGRMPWLYHHYVGHDNNRDYYMLTQKETQVVNDVLYHRWFPQVFVDMHQMGSTGPRMFVPPQTDPLAPEVHSMIFRLADLLGTGMSLRLEEAGKTGVGHDMIYDSYWPGGTRNTAWWKNVVGLLTEVASARIATPIYIEPGELRGGRKGFPEYKRRSNFPSPWAGGWWRLRDVMDYELIALRSLLESCSRYRRDLLTTFYRLNREEIERGASEPPYGFIVPPEQHDPVAAARLVALLLRHGVRVHRAQASFSVGHARYPAGSYVILASQPYRPFLLTMLRPQRYPEVVPYVGGPIIPPYDVTSWSLPISLGVETVEVDIPIEAQLSRVETPEWPGGTVVPGPGGYLIPHSADSAFPALNRLLRENKTIYWLTQAPEGGAVGDIYIPPGEITPEALSHLSREVHVPIRSLAQPPSGVAYRVHAVRVGLYKPWVASMDEGWTRWLLERYEFPFVNLSNQQIKDGSFKNEIDVLILPDVRPSILKEGKPSGEEARFFAPLPPEYAGGLDEEGGQQLQQWVEQGGTLVALDSAADYVIELLALPVTNVLENVSRERFYCPGSMLRLLVDTSHPLAYGLREKEAAYFSNSPAFQTALPDARFERRVVAAYPEHEEDILLSGYLKGADLLERRVAVVEFKVGQGHVVLIGFRAQHRAQTHRTFKLFFNALYLPGLQEEPLPGEKPEVSLNLRDK